MSGQHRHRLRRDLGDPRLALLDQVLEAEVDDLGNVIRPFAQGGHADAHDIQPVIQILAEGLGFDHRFQVLVGRGQNADIDANRFRSAHPLDFSLLQDAQNLGLRGQGHVADFVQEDGASVAELEFSQTLAGGPGERALFVAKQFTLDQIVGNRCAVDGDERLGGPMTVFPDRASNEFLAGATLAGDHDRHVAGGDLADHLEDFLHHAGAAHDALAVVLDVDGGLVGADGTEIGVDLQGVFRESQDLGRIERLDDVVERPVFHRLDCSLSRAEGGHQNHELLRIGGANVLQRLQSAHAAHAQIEKDEVRRRTFFDHGHALFAARCLQQLIAARGKHAGQRVPDLGVVVDDEDAGGLGFGGHDRNAGFGDRGEGPQNRAGFPRAMAFVASDAWVVNEPFPDPRHSAVGPCLVLSAAGVGGL